MFWYELFRKFACVFPLYFGHGKKYGQPNNISKELWCPNSLKNDRWFVAGGYPAFSYGLITSFDFLDIFMEYRYDIDQWMMESPFWIHKTNPSFFISPRYESYEYMYVFDDKIMRHHDWQQEVRVFFIPSNASVSINNLCIQTLSTFEMPLLKKALIYTYNCFEFIDCNDNNYNHLRATPLTYAHYAKLSLSLTRDDVCGAQKDEIEAFRQAAFRIFIKL